MLLIAANDCIHWLSLLIVVGGRGGWSAGHTTWACSHDTGKFNACRGQHAGHKRCGLAQNAGVGGACVGVRTSERVGRVGGLWASPEKRMVAGLGIGLGPASLSAAVVGGGTEWATGSEAGRQPTHGVSAPRCFCVPRAVYETTPALHCGSRQHARYIRWVCKRCRS